jgi:hypothetical protein
MFDAEQVWADEAVAAIGIELGTSDLIEEAVELGYARASLRRPMRWTADRIAPHSDIRSPPRLRDLGEVKA